MEWLPFAVTRLVTHSMHMSAAAFSWVHPTPALKLAEAASAGGINLHVLESQGARQAMDRLQAVRPP